VSDVERWLPVIVGSVLASPVAVAAAEVLARRRRRAGRPARRARATALADVAIVAGTLPWVWMILTPTAAPGGVEPVPGQGLAGMLTHGPSTAIVQVGANLLVFATAGALLPLRLPVGGWAVTAGAAAASAVLESLQYLLPLGRVASVDDVLLNAAGAGLAALATRRWWLGRRRHRAGGETG